MKYDDAETYLDTESEVPEDGQASGTHLGFYLAWIVNSSMASDALRVHADPVKQRLSDGRALLFRRCDGKLMSDDLNEVGNAFTRAYYGSRFFSDYAQAFDLDLDEPDALFVVENTWSNYDRLAQVLDRRLREWRSSVALPDKVELMQRMEAAFLPLVERMSFKRNPNEFSQRSYEISAFTRTGPWGEHRFALRAIDERPQFYGMVVEVTSTLNVLAQALHDDLVIDDPRRSRVLPTTFHAPMKMWLGNWPVPLHSMRPGATAAIPLSDRSQVQPAIVLASERATNKLPGLFRDLETIEGYDRLCCTVPLDASPCFAGYFSRVPLLCGELAGNPRLSAMCDEIEQALGNLTDRSHPNHALHVIQMRQHIQRVRDRLPSK